LKVVLTTLTLPCECDALAYICLIRKFAFAFHFDKIIFCIYYKFIDKLLNVLNNIAGIYIAE